MPTDRCQPIRENIRKSEEGIREAEAVLPELLGPGKTVMINFIKREKAHLTQLRAALRACESGR